MHREKIKMVKCCSYYYQSLMSTQTEATSLSVHIHHFVECNWKCRAKEMVYMGLWEASAN